VSYACYLSPRQSLIPANKRQAKAHSRSLKVLRRVRRGQPLYKAADAEHVKVATVKKYVGQYLHQNAPGKQWKASKSDRLTDLMNVVTPLGTQPVLVRGLRERNLLGQYNVALRKWRRGERGSEAELAGFADQKVAGHPLITDTKLLTTLEDAGVLDFPELYAALAGGK